MTRLAREAIQTACPLCGGVATTSRCYRLGRLDWTVMMCQDCRDYQDALFMVGSELDRQAAMAWVTSNRHREWVTVVRPNA